MHACDGLGVPPCYVVSFLATYHLDDGMDMSVETVLDSDGDTFQEAYLEEWQRVDDGQKRDTGEDNLQTSP